MLARTIHAACTAKPALSPVTLLPSPVNEVSQSDIDPWENNLSACKCPLAAFLFPIKLSTYGFTPGSARRDRISIYPASDVFLETPNWLQLHLARGSMGHSPETAVTHVFWFPSSMSRNGFCNSKRVGCRHPALPNMGLKFLTLNKPGLILDPTLNIQESETSLRLKCNAVQPALKPICMPTFCKSSGGYFPCYWTCIYRPHVCVKIHLWVLLLSLYPYKYVRVQFFCIFGTKKRLLSSRQMERLWLLAFLVVSITLVDF